MSEDFIISLLIILLALLNAAIIFIAWQHERNGAK